VLTPEERDELASIYAHRFVDLLIRRADEIAKVFGPLFVEILFASAADAAKQEERDRLETIGRNVRDGWRKYRIRVFAGIGLLGLDMATRFPASIASAAKTIIGWFVEP
jgi:hypothetical protein